MPAVVELQGVSKRFGSVDANIEVDLTVQKGTFHALVGENGAGKTTLMRLLYGYHQPDSGSIILDGQAVFFRTPHDAISRGVGMVSQHYSIIPELSCLDNLILGAEQGFWLKRESAIERATVLAKQLEFRFDWDSLAETLSPGERQKLEILKLLWRNADVMILDEPTAMLSPEDSKGLFNNLKKLVSEGRTVVLVTHRLSEVFDHCDTVSVMRGGRLISTLSTSEVAEAELAAMVVGTSVPVPMRSSTAGGETVIRVDRLQVRGHRGDWAVDGVDFELRAGECVGIAGVDGSGQRELIQALLGLLPYEGRIDPFDGKTTIERLCSGVALIPEDRHAEGVIDSWPLTENAILGLQRLSAISRGFFIDRKVQNSMCDSIIKRFGTKTSGLSAKMSSLSGGNQQRFVASRAFESNPRLLLAFHPVRGLDILGASLIYDTIRQRCSEGMSALMVSFDLDDLIEHCDRVLVMFSGRLLVPPLGFEKDRSAIGKMMVGLSP
jgi:ABC-type uncharacterized transport system ATPase subunit